MVQLLHTIEEAAGLLGLSERTVYELISRGELVSVQIPSKTGRNLRRARRIEAAEIQRFIQANRQTTP